MTPEEYKCEVVLPLAWDTDYFGIPCGKALLGADTTEEQLQKLVPELMQYTFSAVQNIGNCPEVNRFLALNTRAYLVDINLQFEKSCGGNAPAAREGDCPIVQASVLPDSIGRQLIVERSDFIYSKFVCDPELDRRSGYKVYEKWLDNARFSDNKFFIYCMDSDRLAAYILFNIKDETLTIELVKVNAAYQGRHFATKLLTELQSYAASRGCTVMRVGTQLNNIPAVNLYHHFGFKDVSRTSVYHNWNNG